MAFADSVGVERKDLSGGMRRRPRLLFLAYHFPPAHAIACVRAWNMAKYLSRLGWEIQVVTPDPSLWRNSEDRKVAITNAKREGISLIHTNHQWRWLNPDHLNCWDDGLGWILGGICRTVARNLSVDQAVGWISAAEKTCSMLTPNDVDLILATGPPFSAFRLAKRLAERLNKPYVLDYRDPWTGNPHVNGPESLVAIKEETRLLSGCSAVTVVSPSWAKGLKERFHIGSRVSVVTNGYDPEELASVEPFNFGHHAIIYAGNFYPPKRVISPVLAALKKLRDGGKHDRLPWKFHYYGIHGDHVREEALRFAVTDCVVLHGRVPRADVLSAVRGADVAVVITTVADQMTQEDCGIIPGKLFETLGLGTPILLVSPQGSDVETIALPTRLARGFAGTEIDGLAEYLRTGLRKPEPAPNNLEMFSWPNIAQEIERILRKALIPDQV
jgi:glycosyltransferase involved in cell wall biosynthesis